MRRAQLVATIFVAALVVLAGCGDVSDASGASPTPTVTGTPTETGLTTSTPTAEPTATRTSSSTAQNPQGTLEVHFINVGQSVSTLVISPEKETMLIDSGDWQDDGEYVLQYLREHDIERIDHFVVSHGDADHIGGNAAVIDYYEMEADAIGAIYDPGIVAATNTYEEYLDAVEEHDVTLYETREGDTLPFAGVSVEVLGPPEPYLESDARNENSIVLRLRHGNTSFLFTGDAEDDQEEYLVDTYGSELRSTILKAGHHGSATSTSGALLDLVQPETTIISSSYDSRYGHPDEETLRRLADRGIPAYWTATHGDIVLRSDGEAVSVYTQREAPTGPLDLHDGDPVEPGTAGPGALRATYGGSSTGAQQTAVATDGGTATSEPTDTPTPTVEPTQGAVLSIEEIHEDAAGTERGNLNDEYIVFSNTGDEELALGGWTVRDEADHTYTFPDGFTLDPGDTVTLHTGAGTDNATDLYWGSGNPIWNNGGDTVVVTNADGETVLAEEYS